MILSILSSSPPVSKFDALTPTCRRVGSIPSVFQVERRTKIPLADTDGNPATPADPNWTPLLITPPHQDYPSGHSTLTAAAIAVLAHFFGKNSSIIVYSGSACGRSERIRTELGYEELVEIEEAIRKTIAWKQRNPPSTVNPRQFDYSAQDAAIANLP